MFLPRSKSKSPPKSNTPGRVVTCSMNIENSLRKSFFVDPFFADSGGLYITSVLKVSGPVVETSRVF